MERAARLRATLNNAGISTWFDIDVLGRKDPWREPDVEQLATILEEAILSCDVTVLFEIAAEVDPHEYVDRDRSRLTRLGTTMATGLRCAWSWQQFEMNVSTAIVAISSDGRAVALMDGRQIGSFSSVFDALSKFSKNAKASFGYVGEEDPDLASTALKEINLSTLRKANSDKAMWPDERYNAQVSLNVISPSLTVVIGSAGVGKTTFLKLAARDRLGMTRFKPPPMYWMDELNHGNSTQTWDFLNETEESVIFVDDFDKKHEYCATEGDYSGCAVLRFLAKAEIHTCFCSILDQTFWNRHINRWPSITIRMPKITETNLFYLLLFSYEKFYRSTDIHFTTRSFETISKIAFDVPVFEDSTRWDFASLEGNRLGPTGSGINILHDTAERYRAEEKLRHESGKIIITEFAVLEYIAERLRIHPAIVSHKLRPKHRDLLTSTKLVLQEHEALMTDPERVHRDFTIWYGGMTSQTCPVCWVELNTSANQMIDLARRLAEIFFSEHAVLHFDLSDKVNDIYFGERSKAMWLCKALSRWPYWVVCIDNPAEDDAHLLQMIEEGDLINSRDGSKIDVRNMIFLINGSP